MTLWLRARAQASVQEAAALTQTRDHGDSNRDLVKHLSPVQGAGAPDCKALGATIGVQPGHDRAVTSMNEFINAKHCPQMSLPEGGSHVEFLIGRTR